MRILLGIGAVLILGLGALLWLAREQTFSEPFPASAAESDAAPGAGELAAAGERAAQGLLPAASSTAPREAPSLKRQEIPGEPVPSPPAPAEEAPPRGLQVIGHLLDESTGEPVPGFPLRFESGAQWLAATTDAEGRFALEKPVEGVLLTVVASASAGRLPGSRRLRIREVTTDLTPYYPAGEVELEVVGQRPRSILAVDVVGPDGAPPRSTAVELEWVERGLWTSRRERTNPEGRAEFPFYEPVDAERAFLSARRTRTRAPDLVSPVVELGYPFDRGVQRLVIAPAAALRVDFTAPGVDEGDRDFWEAVQIEVTLVAEVAHSPDAGLLERRVHRSAVLDGLLPGPYRLSWRVEGLEEGGERHLHVAQGASLREVVALPPPRSVVGVAGRIVDESGAGLPGHQLVVTGSGLTQDRLVTDAEGRFELRTPPFAEPPSRLHVSTARFWQDRFEPEEATVDLGTTDLVFQRVERYRSLHFEVLVLDRESGDRIERGRITFVHFLPDGSERLDPRLSFVAAIRDGSSSWVVPDKPGAWFEVTAPGYLPLRGELDPLLDRGDANADFQDLFGRVAPILEPGEEPDFTLELERGYRQRVRVEDERHRPWPGARLHLEGTASAVTDERGDAILEAASWPDRVVVEIPGGVRETFPLEEPLGWAPIVLTLERE